MSHLPAGSVQFSRRLVRTLHQDMDDMATLLAATASERNLTILTATPIRMKD